jgi:hypothetical protein
MLDTKILIPDKYVLISGDNIRMQKSFSIPPCIKSREVDNLKCLVKCSIQLI